MNYLIINLTRFGDLLQTACTISGLKKSGNHSISLICLEQFANATTFIPHLDAVIPFKGATYLKHLANGEINDWAFAYQALTNWVQEIINTHKPDFIINLTPTAHCRMLAKLFHLQNPKIKEIGFCLDEYGFTHNTNAWTSYTEAVTQNRSGSPFNLIDEFRAMLGLAPQNYELVKPSQELQEKANQILTQKFQSLQNSSGLFSKEPKAYIGFQLGASNPIRQWSIENFAKLATLLWNEKQYVPVLLGTKSEEHLVKQFCTCLDNTIPFINYCGQSTLEELGAMLSCLKALISNDTGTLHLATGLHIPVIGIYLATAQVWDTGPYGESQICIEPELACHPCNFKTACTNGYLCHKIIDAKTVYNTLCYLLKEEIADQDFLEKSKNTARIWQAFFENDGFINYTSLQNSMDTRSYWIQCQRILYKNILNSLQHNDNSANFSLTKLGNFALTSATSELQKIVTILLLLREHGNLFALKPTPKNQENFLSSVQRLRNFLKNSEYFIPLYLLFEQLLQEKANDINEIIQFFDILREKLSLFLAELS